MAIKVLVIDDSGSMRSLLSALLEQDSRIELVAAVGDAEQGRTEIIRNRPDVVLLDIELPRLDGISFLRELMAGAHPLPVLIISSLTSGDDDKAIEALRAGAVDVISKTQSAERLVDFATLLGEKIVAAAHARPNPMSLDRHDGSLSRVRQQGPSEQVIAIGASTGGTTAVERILSGVDRTGPAIVVALHLPGRVSAQFARRLNDHLPLNVTVAEDGDRLMRGSVFIGSGHCHVAVRKYSTGFRVRLIAGEATDRVRPSINTLFNSVADSAGEEAMGVLLTGMGDDGASGLLKMRQAGALTVAEDESTAVVFGMPKAAQALGAASRILPLQQINSAIIDFAGRRAFARHRL